MICGLNSWGLAASRSTPISVHPLPKRYEVYVNPAVDVLVPLGVRVAVDRGNDLVRLAVAWAAKRWHLFYELFQGKEVARVFLDRNRSPLFIANPGDFPLDI